MKHEFEIVGSFASSSDAEELVYAPLGVDLTSRSTRHYVLETSQGDDSLAVREFVDEVLFDEVSQDLHVGREPALDGFLFFVDYGMKKGALDLEKESIIRYYQSLKSPGFTLEDLTITTRIYLFQAGAGSIEEGGEKATAQRIVRDVCNPAIHTWELTYARDCA